MRYDLNWALRAGEKSPSRDGLLDGSHRRDGGSKDAARHRPEWAGVCRTLMEDQAKKVCRGSFMSGQGLKCHLRDAEVSCSRDSSLCGYGVLLDILGAQGWGQGLSKAISAIPWPPARAWCSCTEFCLHSVSPSLASWWGRGHTQTSIQSRLLTPVPRSKALARCSHGNSQSVLSKGGCQNTENWRGPAAPQSSQSSLRTPPVGV